MKKFLIFAFVSIYCTSCSNNTFKDERDNNVYKTIKIGNKIWMLENLNFNLDNQGSYFYPSRMLSIDSNKLNEALAFYRIEKNSIKGLNDTNILKKFNHHLDSIMRKYPKGWRYYTFEAAKKACPPGWHIANNEDWLELNSFSKTNEIAKLQLDWIGYWKKKYTSNPIIEIRLGDYFGDKRGCTYWSNTETLNEINIVDISSDNIIRINNIKNKPRNEGDVEVFAASIRCVKDVK